MVDAAAIEIWLKIIYVDVARSIFFDILIFHAKNLFQEN